MIRAVLLAGALAPVLLAAAPALAEMVVWGIQAEQLEYRAGESDDFLAWDASVFAGTDALRLVWRSEAEFGLKDEAFEVLENQLRLQVPISDFFDAVAGIRLDTPAGPDRLYGVLGVHGLAPQWFEIDADLYLSENPSFRLEVEYEALITNRLILVPSVEFDLPVADDPDIGVGAWGPKLELGLRLSYDLVDRAVSPYIGVHYERVFGDTADIARAGGEDVDAVRFVIGSRLVF